MASIRQEAHPSTCRTSTCNLHAWCNRLHHHPRSRLKNAGRHEELRLWARKNTRRGKADSTALLFNCSTALARRACPPPEPGRPRPGMLDSPSMRNRHFSLVALRPAIAAPKTWIGSGIFTLLQFKRSPGRPTPRCGIHAALLLPLTCRSSRCTSGSPARFPESVRPVAPQSPIPSREHGPDPKVAPSCTWQTTPTNGPPPQRIYSKP